ncbi:hypothetical protein HZS_3372 [Henneguya salminicola]|nr:hypothetical protein HZS_3372 [Henneguya salminicola]
MADDHGSTMINRFRLSLRINGDITTNKNNIGCINNSSERYNSWMNELFFHAHTTICMFAEVIRNEFEYYEQCCLEIRINGSNIRYKNK